MYCFLRIFVKTQLKKMTDKELKELVASLAINSAKTDKRLERVMSDLAIQTKKTEIQLAKTDAQLAKTDIQLAKTDAKLERIGIMVGGVSNNQGNVAEEFYINSLQDSLQLSGIKFDYIDKNISRKKGKITDEYDIVLANGDVIYIIEVKYKVHLNDLERIINKKHPNFKKLYPEYKNYKHLLGIATFHISDELKEQALSMGINVLQRKGKVIEELVA